MWKTLVSALIVLLYGLFLNACASGSDRPRLAEPTIVYKPVEVPDALLTCKHAPLVPGPKARDREVALYISCLWDAHASCAENLERVRSFLREREGARVYKPP